MLKVPTLYAIQDKTSGRLIQWAEAKRPPDGKPRVFDDLVQANEFVAGGNLRVVPLQAVPQETA